MIICEILLFILICYFWELKSTMGEIGALTRFAVVKYWCKPPVTIMEKWHLLINI